MIPDWPVDLLSTAREDAPGVWVADRSVQAVTAGLVDELAVAAAERGRARVLLHRDRNDPVQQMVIALRGGTYVRPHLNDRGFKSWQALRGSLLFVEFEAAGTPACAVTFGDGAHALSVRLLEPSYHTILPRSEVAVYVETCTGPFRGTVYADWAPAENDSGAVAWVEKLVERLELRDA